MKKHIILFIAGLILTPWAGRAQTAVTPDQANKLVGLWKAKKRFGPDVRGTLVIRKAGANYIAEMMGRTMAARSGAGELVFEFPGGAGIFRGRLVGKEIRGFWIRPGTPVSGYGEKFAAASPVALALTRAGTWTGAVDPADDTFTIFLMITKRADGTLAVLMRNPERDIGNQIGASSIVVDGTTLKLFGKRAKEKEDHVLTTGTFDAENDVLTLTFMNRGMTYDFLREDKESEFYPRGRTPGQYVYHSPAYLDDGWQTASVEDVGIDRAGIEKVIQKIIDTPETAPETPQTHGLIVIRHGKLVLEEYFHGFSRDSLHNNRSAAKSITATLIGAAMYAGSPLKLSSPVYEVMNGGKVPPDLDAQKRSMTLEHLLMMSSGIFCDDNNDNAPGQESNMWEQQKEPNFYKLYLSLPMDRKPGEKSVYCSNDPNLALAMLQVASGEFPLYAFDRLISTPMKIGRYSWGTDHAGNPYGGGGSEFMLRDFAKFGQLMLNDGTWQGRRILSRAFVDSASSPRTQIGSRKYGYLWWVGVYPYEGRNIKVFWALGNGGNTISVIPELDLVVATYSGGYFSKAYGYPTGDLVPNYILPTVKQAR